MELSEEEQKQQAAEAERQKLEAANKAVEQMTEQQQDMANEIALANQEAILQQQEQQNKSAEQKCLLPFADTFAKVHKGVDLAKEFEDFSKVVKVAEDSKLVEKTIHTIEEAKDFAEEMGMMLSHNQISQLSGALSSGGGVAIGLIGKVFGALSDLDDPMPNVNNQFGNFLQSQGKADLPQSGAVKAFGHAAKFSEAATSTANKTLSTHQAPTLKISNGGGK